MIDYNLTNKNIAKAIAILQKEIKQPVEQKAKKPTNRQKIEFLFNTKYYRQR